MPFLAIMDFWKMVTIFYKDYLEKPIVILVILDSTSPIAKLTIKLSAKKKQKHLAKLIMKYVK